MLSAHRFPAVFSRRNPNSIRNICVPFHSNNRFCCGRNSLAFVEMKGKTNLNTSAAQRMHRISPDNPVRRCLFPVDNIEEKARDDNCRNNFKEELARESIEKREKWNFDFDREEALDGPYEWFKLNGDKFVRMDIQRENLEPKGKSMQLENESTPRSNKDDNVPRLRKRTNDRPLASPSVKRKISYD